MAVASHFGIILYIDQLLVLMVVYYRSILEYPNDSPPQAEIFGGISCFTRIYMICLNDVEVFSYIAKCDTKSQKNPPAAGQSRLYDEIRKEHATPLIVSRSKQLGGLHRVFVCM